MSRWDPPTAQILSDVKYRDILVMFEKAPTVKLRDKLCKTAVSLYKKCY